MLKIYTRRKDVQVATIVFLSIDFFMFTGDIRDLEKVESIEGGFYCQLIIINNSHKFSIMFKDNYVLNSFMAQFEKYLKDQKQTFIIHVENQDVTVKREFDEKKTDLDFFIECGFSN